MNIEDLMQKLNLSDTKIIVNIIKPVRNGEIYKTGIFAGYKCGLYGAKHGWIKKPKVYVGYNIFTYGKSQHLDWIDVDNCTFEIK